MAQDITSLIVRIESIEAEQANHRLNKLATAGGTTEKSMNKLSGAAKALGAAIAGIGFTSLINNASQAGKEILVFSQQLNVSTEVMSQWGFAAKSVGFETEKMADIFKDVSEKIGDAFLNNAGEAKEALDRLGIPIREIVDLSPDQQLLRISESLNKIQSQSGKIQIMEALANDASRLIPLLDNNAESLKELTAQFDNMGGTLSKLEAEQLFRANKALSDIATTFSIVSTDLAISLMPQLEALSNFLQNNLQPAIDFFVKGFKLAGTAIGGVAAIISFVVQDKMDMARSALDFMKKDLENIYNDISPQADAILVEEIIRNDAHIAAFEYITATLAEMRAQELFEIRENEAAIAKVKKEFREKETAERVAANQSALASAGSFFGSLASLEGANTKRSFENQKKWLYAETVISTIASAQAAFYSAMKVGGPYLAAAAAGAALLSGYARAKQIQNTSFDSTSTPTSAGGTGGLPSPAQSQQTPGGEGQQNGTVVTVNVHGNFYGDGSIDDLIRDSVISNLNNENIALQTQQGERVRPVT